MRGSVCGRGSLCRMSASAQDISPRISSHRAKLSADGEGKCSGESESAVLLLELPVDTVPFMREA
jgi:hypothetical protein